MGGHRSNPVPVFFLRKVQKILASISSISYNLTVDAECGFKQRVATTDTTAGSRQINMAVNYVIKKNVTAEVWKWVEGVEKVFTVKGPIRMGRAPKPGATISTAAELLDVTDATDGKDKVIVLNKVLRDNLVEQYPGDTFVGKSFSVTMGPVPVGKKYKTMQVAEIELSAPEPVTKSKKN